jgi:hypothetical protein
VSARSPWLVAVRRESRELEAPAFEAPGGT